LTEGTRTPIFNKRKAAQILKLMDQTHFRMSSLTSLDRIQARIDENKIKHNDSKSYQGSKYKPALNNFVSLDLKRNSGVLQNPQYH
jgi:hypothetical protein